jgi:NADPH-dependent 7-cyano-7-deazaguanine reductase QueF
VKFTLIETDYTKDRLDPRREQYHTTQRNVTTMRELAAAILATCDFVEHCNPAWAERWADWDQSGSTEEGDRG